jgi:hypothetical protein
VEVDERLEADVGMPVLDDRTGVGERVGRGSEVSEVLAADRARVVIEPGRDAHTGERHEAALGELDAPGRRVLRDRTREHRHRELEVGRRARDRTEGVDVGAGRTAADVVEVAEVRDDAVARLQ